MVTKPTLAEKAPSLKKTIAKKVVGDISTAKTLLPKTRRHNRDHQHKHGRNSPTFPQSMYPGINPDAFGSKETLAPTLLSSAEIQKKTRQQKQGQNSPTFSQSLSSGINPNDLEIMAPTKKVILEEHKIITVGCKYCGIIFETSEDLKDHEHKCRKSYKKPAIPCDECQKLFKSANTLKVHKVKKHPENINQVCEITPPGNIS